MQLEMPYLMNVLLYIHNKDITLIPFISKKSNEACEAMRINPWKNWSDSPEQDYNNIIKTFPRLETLRIDVLSLIVIQKEINYENIIMIDIVKEDAIHFSMLNGISVEVKNKIIQSYSFTIYKQTRKIYTQYLLSHNFDYLTKYPQISFVYSHFDIMPSILDIKCLNKYGSSIKFVIEVNPSNTQELLSLRQRLINNVSIVITRSRTKYVIPHLNNLEFCMYPLKNNDTMKLHEKYYLPTILTLQYLQHDSCDYSIFNHVKEIIITHQITLHNIEVKLPITTTHINVFNQNTNLYDEFKVLNWNELNNIQLISDFDNLNIPYPQITCEQSKIRHNNRQHNWYEFIVGLLNGIMCLYWISLLFTIGVLLQFNSINFVINSVFVVDKVYQNFFIFSLILIALASQILSPEFHWSNLKQDYSLCSVLGIHLVYITLTPLIEFNNFFTHNISPFLLLAFVQTWAFINLIKIRRTDVNKFFRIVLKGNFLSKYVDDFTSLYFGYKIHIYWFLYVLFVCEFWYCSIVLMFSSNTVLLFLNINVYMYYIKDDVVGF